MEIPSCYRHPGREATIRCQRCRRPICTECMHDAVVGFQCGNCVSSGMKETRQGLGAYGGIRSTRPALTSQVLIGINVAVWAGIVLTGGIWQWLGRLLALTPQATCRNPYDFGGYYRLPKAECLSHPGLVWFDGVSGGAAWQIITTAFTHEAFWHIGFNMLALWFLGPQLEEVIGRARFLTVYLASAVTGSTLVMLFSDSTAPTLGASGAIFGLMGAALVVAYKNHGDVRGLLVWLGMNVAITFLSPNISWQGHFGGLLGGVIITAIVVYAPKNNRAVIQWGGVALCMAICAALIAWRVTQLAF